MQFEGSEVVEQQNEHFSGTWSDLSSNPVTWAWIFFFCDLFPTEV